MGDNSSSISSAVRESHVVFVSDGSIKNNGTAGGEEQIDIGEGETHN